MMYMTNEIMQYIMSQQPPHQGFGFGVSESPDGIFITVALDEFAKYSESQQENLALWIGQIVSHIRSLGVPCFLIRKDTLNG